MAYEPPDEPVDATDALAVAKADCAFVEASQLGWRPGVWPSAFTFAGQDYRRVEARWTPYGALAGFVYRSPLGTLVEVLND